MARTKKTTTELVPAGARSSATLLGDKTESLAAWFTLYVELEAGANSENTQKAKRADLQAFLTYFSQVTASDEPDQWTRSVTGGFLRHLERKDKSHRPPSTACSPPCGMRPGGSMRSGPSSPVTPPHHRRPRRGRARVEGALRPGSDQAQEHAEQLIRLKLRKNQQPLKSSAVLLVLLGTGLRVSELLECDLKQYQGKHLVNVKRKGRKVSRSVFPNTHKALDRYIEHERGMNGGPLRNAQRQPVAHERTCRTS